ncbi:MAG TPA: ABC transporter permease [Gemmatimonadaceae bacterium]|nr:ABC transporter permease [Gemmatimonadaceae bacterium]
MPASHGARAPAAARLLVTLLVPPERAELVLGDLEEDFVDAVARRGRAAARRAYWRAALRSALDGGRWHRAAPRRAPRPPHVIGEALVFGTRFALRSLLRRPTFTAVTVLILALAIGAGTAAFTVVHRVLLREPPYAAPHELVTLWKTDPARRADPAFADSWNRIGLSLAELERLGGATQAFGAVAGYRTERRILSGAGDPAEVLVAHATPSLLPLLGVRPRLGRWFDAGEAGVPVVVISHALWSSSFGREPAALGRTIRVDGAPFTIVGVLPQGFHLAPLSPLMQQGTPAVWLPVGLDPYDRRARDYEVLARLRPSTSRAEAAELARRALAPEGPTRERTGIAASARREAEVAGLRRPLYLLGGSVAFFLLLACVNVGALSLGEGQARQRELATRITLGASRGRLVRELLTESLLLAAAGTALAVPTALLVLRRLLELAPLPLAVADAGVQATVLAVAAALGAIVALLFGIAPAWTVSRSAARLAASGSRATAGGGALRHGLVVAQFALTTVLLVSAALLTRSLQLERGVPPGFAAADRLVVRVKRPAGPDPGFDARIRERLAHLPGVEHAAVSGRVPLLEPPIGWQVARGSGTEEGGSVAVGLEAVSDDYFRTMGIPIVEGRGIEPRDVSTSPRVAVVSRTLAERLWPGEPPLGQRLSDPFGSYTVVGVAGDVHDVGLDAAPDGVLYASIAQGPLPGGHAFILHAPHASLEAVAEEARRAVHAAAPDAAVDAVLPLEQVLANAVAADRYRATLALSFAVLATVMGAVGLAGMVMRDVGRRLRELAIRMALGATALRVARLPIAQLAASVAAGAMIGLGGSLAVGRLLAGYLYGVTARDPWAFATTVAVLGGIVLLTLAVALRRIAGQELAPLLADER